MIKLVVTKIIIIFKTPSKIIKILITMNTIGPNVELPTPSRPGKKLSKVAANRKIGKTPGSIPYPKPNSPPRKMPLH